MNATASHYTLRLIEKLKANGRNYLVHRGQVFTQSGRIISRLGRDVETTTLDSPRMQDDAENVTWFHGPIDLGLPRR